MTALAERREMVVGIDPQHQSRHALAWAADEAHRRKLALRLLLAVPPSHDKRHADATSHHIELRRRGAEALTSAVSRARERRGKLELTTDLLDGVPAVAPCRRSGQARMVVLGSRRLGRAEEFFSASSVVVPVSAQANCPVVVVGKPEHVTQQPPYWLSASTAASLRALLLPRLSTKQACVGPTCVRSGCGRTPWSSSWTRRRRCGSGDGCSRKQPRAGRRSTRMCP